MNQTHSFGIVSTKLYCLSYMNTYRWPSDVRNTNSLHFNLNAITVNKLPEYAIRMKRKHYCLRPVWSSQYTSGLND